MGQPATAAIVVACIFLALATVYFSYRLYLKVYHRGARKLANSQIEDQYRNPLAPNGGSPQEEYPPSAPVASSYRQRHLYQQQQQRTIPVSFQPQQPYRKSLATPSSPLDSSGSSSPRGDDTEPITPPLAAHTPGSVFGSNSSTNAIQRQYAAAKHYGTSPSGTLTPSALAALASTNGQPQPVHTPGTSSVYGGSDQGGLAGTGANSAPGSALGVPSSASIMHGGQRVKRDSYLPHLNRDNIQIVTPSPLGFGLGGMATATDQRTLAFSKASSIGENRSLLSDPLLSATISDPASGQQGGPDGSAAPAANGNSVWGQRVQAYRTAGTDASSSSHHHGRGLSVSSIGPAPGPSVDTPAAEYLAQQKRELQLKMEQQQQQPRQPPSIAPPTSTSEQQRLGTLPPSQQQQQQHGAQSYPKQQPPPPAASNLSSSGGVSAQTRRSSGPGSAPPSAYRGPSPAPSPAPINSNGASAAPSPSVGRISESESTGSGGGVSGPPTLHRKQSAEERRLSALTARQSPLQRMSSGELWTDGSSAPSPVP